MASFVVVGYGIDDITLGFDMEGSGSIERLNGLPWFANPPRQASRRSCLLGEMVAPLGSFCRVLEGGYETAICPGESCSRGRAVPSDRARRRRGRGNEAYGSGRSCQLREALGYATRCSCRWRLRGGRRQA